MAETVLIGLQTKLHNDWNQAHTDSLDTKRKLFELAGLAIHETNHAKGGSRQGVDCLACPANLKDPIEFKKHFKAEHLDMIDQILGMSDEPE